MEPIIITHRVEPVIITHRVEPIIITIRATRLASREEEAALRKHGREGLLLRSRACAGLLFAFFYSLLSSRSRPTREGYFPQDWSSLPAGTPSGGRVGLRLELAWLDRAETPC